MSAAPDEFRPAVRRRVRYALALCCALTAPVFLPAAAALAADDRADQQVPETVVGELLQAWPEPESAHDAADHGHDGPLSWVRTAAGEAVRVPTEDLGGVPAGARVELTVGDSVPDEASAEDGFEPPREVLAAEMVQAPPTAEARPLPATGRTNAVTVVMVAPAGAQPDGTTLGQVVSQVDGPVSRFWSEQTGGAVRVGVADAHDWLTTTAGCSNPTALWAEVAARVGFTSGAGRHLLLYVSGSADLPGCYYALGEVGSGPGSGGASYVRDAMPSLIAHELGHNFGLGHSSAVQCDGTVETGSCRTEAYRDHYDVMGLSWDQLGSLSAPHAARLGVLPGAEQREVTVDGPGATVDLAPVSAAGGVRALRLVDAEGVAYWLEYRTAAGRDAWLARPGNRFRLQSGVLLRRAGGMPDTSLLLDGTPSAASGWAGDLQVALPVGTPVPVAGGQFSLTVSEVSPQDASVTVTTSPAAAAAGTASESGSTPDRLPGRACGTWTPDAPCPAAPGHAPAGTANSEDAATTMSSGSSSLPDDARPPVADGAAEDAPSGGAGAVSREADRMRTPALTEQVSGPGLTPTTLVAMGGVLGSVTLLVRTTSRLLLRAGRR